MAPLLKLKESVRDGKEMRLRCTCGRTLIPINALFRSAGHPGMFKLLARIPDQQMEKGVAGCRNRPSQGRLSFGTYLK